MTTFTNLTGNHIKIIQRSVQHTTWATPTIYNYAKVHGMTKNVGKGIINHTTTKWEKMDPGQISAGFQGLPDSRPGFTEVDTTLCLLAIKVVLEKQHVDAWSSNNLVGTGDMISQGRWKIHKGLERDGQVPVGIRSSLLGHPVPGHAVQEGVFFPEEVGRSSKMFHDPGL